MEKGIYLLILCKSLLLMNVTLTTSQVYVHVQVDLAFRYIYAMLLFAIVSLSLKYPAD